MTPTISLRAPALVLLCVAVAACSGNGPGATAGTAPVTQAYTAAARGRVDIEGGLLSLSVPRDGVVVRLPVHEGAHVKAGDVIVALDDTPATLAVDAAVAQQGQVTAQLASFSQRIEAATKRAKRLAAAEASGAGDGQSADDSADALAQLVAGQQAAKADVALATQKVAVARYELGQRVLRTPTGGTVTRVMSRPGAAVSSGVPLVVILPDAPRIVRAEVNEAYAGLVRPGMHADVTAETDDGGTQRRATVLRVGSVIGPGTLDDDAQARATARTVECVLTFDTPQALLVGQRVLVRFDRADAQKR